MAEVVVVEPADGAPSTALGLALKDEGVSARLAEAWAAYPKDLHQALADDLYGRLDDNMAGAEEQLEAALGFLCALLRDLGRSFNAAEFWADSPRFAREKRKIGSNLLPVWLPPFLEALATAVRERANQAPGQSTADTRRILNTAVPPGVKSRRQEFATIVSAIRPAYPAGASIGRRARLVAATWTLRLALYVANYVVERDPEDRATREVASFADIATEFDIPPDTLTRCVMLTSDGVAVGSDPPDGGRCDDRSDEEVPSCARPPLHTPAAWLLFRTWWHPNCPHCTIQ